MRRLILLGTGTGVGKTHLGARLVRSWRQRGHPAWGLKPVESGIAPIDPDGVRGPSDAELLRADGPVTAAGLHHRALRDPVSPHLAARREGLELLLPEIVQWVERSERELAALYDDASHALSLIETAGGACSPFSPTSTCAHLARSLSPATVGLVAPDALGVLHDVSATLHALHRLECPVDFVLLSGSRPADQSTGTNAAELERTVFPLLGPVAPRLRTVFRLPAGSTEVGDLLDAWAALGLGE